MRQYKMGNSHFFWRGLSKGNLTMEISSLVSQPPTRDTYQLPLRPASVGSNGSVTEPGSESNVKLPSIHDMLSDVRLGMQPSFFQPRTFTPSPVMLPASSTSSPMVILQPVGAYSYQQQVFPPSPRPQSVLSGSSSNVLSERPMVTSLSSSSPSSIPSTTSTRQPVSPAAIAEKKVHKPALAGSSPSDNKKRRSNLPKRTTTILSDWLVSNLNHPYPNPRQKLELIEQTGLTSQQLSNWFINARRRKINILREVQNNTRETL